MSALRRWMVVAGAVVLGRRRGGSERRDGATAGARAGKPSEPAPPTGGAVDRPGAPPDQPQDRRLSLSPGEPRFTAPVLALLAVSSLASIAFAAVYVLDLGTQLLGLTLGLAFLALGAAAVVAGQRLVPRIRREEPLGEHRHPQDERRTAELVAEGGTGVSRRGLLKVAAGTTVGLAGTAAAFPAASLGPVLETERLLEAPWRAGRRLVHAGGRPVRVDDLDIGGFLTAFPEGVEKRGLDVSVIVVRLEPAELRLPPDREDWAPLGLLAFSKTCTHAACAVSMFRHPLFDPTADEARLVCPCHYSGFDPATGGRVVQGPAGRQLPQLPLDIGADGVLLAAGDMTTPPGPSWPLVRD